MHADHVEGYCGFGVGYLVTRIEDHIQSGNAKNPERLRHYAGIKNFSHPIRNLSEKEFSWQQNPATSSIPKMKWLKHLIEKMDCQEVLLADYVCGDLISIGNVLCTGRPFSLLDTIETAKNQQSKYAKAGSPARVERGEKIKQLEAIILNPPDRTQFDYGAAIGHLVALEHVKSEGHNTQGSTN